MDSIPDPIFVKMCKGITTLLIDDVLYKTRAPLENEIVTENYVAFLDVNELLPLIELEHNGVLENIYRIEDDKAIGEFKKSYLATGEVFISDRHFQELKQEVKLLEFIVQEVLPFYLDGRQLKAINLTAPSRPENSGSTEKCESRGGITTKGAQLSSSLRRFGRIKARLPGEEIEESQNSKSIPSEPVQENKPKKRTKNSASSSSIKQLNNSLLYSQIIQGRDIMVSEDLIYYLTTEKTPNHTVIDLNGQKFYPKISHNIPDFITLTDLYKKAFIAKFKEEAALDSPQIFEFKNKYESFKKILESKIVMDAGISLVKQRCDDIYFCLDVPEYINTDRAGNLYRWPENKIGVRVYLDGRSIMYSPKSVVINSTGSYNSIDEDGRIMRDEQGNKLKQGREFNYIHMFLGGSSDFAELCTNRYVPPDNFSLAQKIARAANVAKSVLMSGWKTNPEVGPHHPLEQSYFRKLLISREDAERLRIPITNTN